MTTQPSKELPASSKTETSAASCNSAVSKHSVYETSHNRLPIPRSQTAESALQTSFSNTSSVPSHQEPSAASPSLFFTRHLLGIDSETTPDALEDALSVASKRRGVYNLIQVPTRLEHLLTVGQFICLDEFLTVFTYLPLRLVLSLLSSISLNSFVPLRFSLPYPKSKSTSRTVHVSRAVDALHMSLLVISALSLSFFDISWIYHNIRGQSVIKLYVVFNVIEIFDRLCSSFGIDILDSLGWTTASAVQFFTRGRRDSTSRADRAHTLQGIALLTRMTIDYAFALVYILVHATLLLTWVVTLNVAINTQNNALITLLVSNNFVELKGAVFKSFKVQNLFQIACSDAVERFQMTVFLGVMLIVTSGDQTLFSTWGVIFVCEVVVDWIKHAFVTKFNRIPPRVYDQFLLVICDDIATAKSQSVVRSIGGSGVSKRIGFVNLPLAALVTRMSMSSVLRLPKTFIVLLWLSLVAIKTALSIILIGNSWRKIRSTRIDDKEDADHIWMKKLMQVERYDLVAKNS